MRCNPSADRAWIEMPLAEFLERLDDSLETFAAARSDTARLLALTEIARLPGTRGDELHRHAHDIVSGALRRTGSVAAAVRCLAYDAAQEYWAARCQSPVSTISLN